MTNFVRLHWAALRALLVLTAITGLAYPLFVWAVAQLPGLREHAEGSILTADGKPVGSRLIGQSFTDSGGNPLPQYFQSRPRRRAPATTRPRRAAATWGRKASSTRPASRAC